jgi:hypothetical protein
VIPMEAVPERAIGVYTRRSATGTLIETYHDGYEVNESGVFIWSLVGGGSSVAQITERLAERYALTGEHSAEVVQGFLAELAGRGFVGFQQSTVTEDPGT